MPLDPLPQVAFRIPIVDTLQLKVVKELNIFEETTEVVEIFVNGRNLRKIVRDIELPFATRERKPNLAGGYTGLPPENVFLPSRRFLSEREKYYDFNDSRGRIPVLGCGCGVVGCWPLLVEIVETEDQVIWGNFRQPHRGSWSYDSLEPFVFDRAQYLAQLERTGDEAVQYE